MKTEVLIGIRGKKKIVLGISTHVAYSDELKLLWEILYKAELKARHSVAYGYYYSVRLIKYMEDKSIRCVVPISETIHQKVRNAYRKLVKSRYEDERRYKRIYGLNRYKVE